MKPLFWNSLGVICPDKSAAIVVYGAGGPTLESFTAVEKLQAAGYRNVTDFAPGLAAWQEAGLPVEGHGAAPSSDPDFDGSWAVDTEKSVIRWTGRNLFNHHEGTVPLSGGRLVITGGELQEASFRIDLRRIACTDLTDPVWRNLLLQHLADRDFFLTSEFPEATFSATSARPVPDASPGTPDYQIQGILNLRGVDQPLEFPAVIAAGGDGTLTAQAWMEIDRTRWGVNYGSGRLFAWLGKHVVNDGIGLHLKIHATRQPGPENP